MILLCDVSLCNYIYSIIETLDKLINIKYIKKHVENSLKQKKILLNILHNVHLV